MHLITLLVACQQEEAVSPAEPCAMGARSTDWEPLCPAGQSRVSQVDPMIGTQGSGNTIPGPMRPHGMVKLSPDSEVESGSVDGYEHDAEAIEGFSHLHLEGPGGSLNGYSNILLQPLTGPLDPTAYAATFEHDDEVAEVGYYAVTLAGDIRVELAATAHTGLHRYTFPAGSTPKILLDVGHSRGASRGGEIQLVDARTIEGYGAYSTHPVVSLALSAAGAPETTADLTVYFSMQLSEPMSGHGVWSGEDAVIEEGADAVSGAWSGAWVELDEGVEVVEVRVGISLVSVAQARAHREAEADGVSLEQARDDARAEWDCLLSRVQVEGDAEEQTMLYTALYHSLMQPTDFTEGSGEFVVSTSGAPEVCLACEGRRFFADDWCMWDTYRTSHPLATLLEPETVDDRVASMLVQYERGGWLPKCTWAATGYSRVMTGNHAVPIIADAWVKGLRDYDEDLAWEAVEKAGMEDTEALLIDSICGYFNLGTPPEYIDLGYVPHECDTDQSASMTQEHAFDDWATAQLAGAMGHTEAEARFRARAESWRNHWDADVGFVRGRYRDGSWVEPFDPTDGTDFVESSAWIYTFFVPHDVDGLIDTIGGEEAFVEKLDAFFDEGHFDASNEPSFHIPLLYNRAGAAWKTQARVHALLRESFSASPGGLPGNDDAGATSAWYALLALGLYPLAPGDGHYELTTPLFERAEIALHGGKTFTIVASRSSEAAIYIAQAALNGVPLERTWITHEELTAGGELVLTLVDAPPSWP